MVMRRWIKQFHDLQVECSQIAEFGCESAMTRLLSPANLINQWSENVRFKTSILEGVERRCMIVLGRSVMSTMENDLRFGRWRETGGKV